MIPYKIFSAWAIFIAIAQIIHAAAPPPLQLYAYARVGSKFYVQGGISQVNSTIKLNSNQLYSLDLATPWSTTSPPWTALANGPSALYPNGMLYSSNNQSFLSVSLSLTPNATYSFQPYNVTTNTWGGISWTTTMPDIFQSGFMPMVDPTTGIFYIPGASNMNFCNPALNNWAWTTIPASDLTSRNWGSTVYNSARKTIMYTGGFNYQVNVVHLDAKFIITEYSPSTGQWSTLLTNAAGAPSPMGNHCTAVSEDGSMLVIFGGRTVEVSPGAFTGAIYLLNIATGAWTSGPSYSTPLVDAGCMIIGNQFLAWGGGPNAVDTTTNAAPLIFDLSALAWTSTYTPPAYYWIAPTTTTTTKSTGTVTNTPGLTTSPETKSGSSSGAIIGGVVACIAVIALVAGFTVVRRRQTRRQKLIESEEKERLSKRMMLLEAELANSKGGNRSDGGDGFGGSSGLDTNIGSDSDSTLAYPMHLRHPQRSYSPITDGYSAPFISNSPLSNARNLPSGYLQRPTSPDALISTLPHIYNPQLNNPFHTPTWPPINNNNNQHQDENHYFYNGTPDVADHLSEPSAEAKTLVEQVYFGKADLGSSPRSSPVGINGSGSVNQRGPQGLVSPFNYDNNHGDKSDVEMQDYYQSYADRSPRQNNPQEGTMKSLDSVQ